MSGSLTPFRTTWKPAGEVSCQVCLGTMTQIQNLALCQAHHSFLVCNYTLKQRVNEYLCIWLLTLFVYSLPSKEGLLTRTADVSNNMLDTGDFELMIT